MNSSIVVTPDDHLVTEIRSSLTSTQNCELTHIRSDEDYRHALSAASSPLVLVDLRNEYPGPTTLQFLQHLPAHAKLRIVAIVDQGAPIGLVPEVDALVSGYLTWPSELPLVPRLLTSNNGIRHQIATGLAPQRVLEVNGFRFVTRTPTLFTVLEQIEQIAPHDVTILIVGETGTGKTSLAQLVHQMSDRSEERFLTTACGALPPDLIESELFGHVRGAFTSADRSKIGRFEAADRGTLLLDEIDVLGPKEQARLLRVIETGEYEPVGSAETFRSNARLIVAANVDLKLLTDRNQFRSDLYYRLNVLEFRLPPLRERPLDLVPLAMDFIQESSQTHGIDVRFVSPRFLETIKNYDWPGNIRELKNQMRRAVLFCKDGVITPDVLSLPAHTNVQGTNGKTVQAAPNGWTIHDRVARSEIEILEEALRANGNKRTATAKALGISRVGLYKKMRKYGLLTTKANVAEPQPTEDE